MFPCKGALKPTATYKTLSKVMSQAELDALAVEHEMDVQCEVKSRITRPSGRPCSIDRPCWIWGCTNGCEEAYREAPFLQQEAHEFLGSGDGRIDAWCAEQSRKAGTPPSHTRRADTSVPPKTEDSKEHPSFG